jgi:restriction system protein
MIRLSASGAAMTVPDYQTLMLPLLKCAEGKDIQIPEVAGKIADDFKLTQAERDQLLPSG